MIQKEMENYGITRENMLEIAIIVSNKMIKVKNLLMDEYDIHFSNKNLSEIIGKMFEKETASYLSNVTDYEVLNAQSDKDSDLNFTIKGESEKNVEIKVTSTKNTWTGGEFSQRPLDYLLISWGKNYEEYFIAYAHLEKEDWTSHFKKRFYGPSFKVKDLKDKSDKVILLGTINERGTGVIRENIFQKKLR